MLSYKVKSESIAQSGSHRRLHRSLIGSFWRAYSRDDSPSDYDGGQHYCARSTDDYRQFDGTSSTSRDYRFWQGLYHLLPPTGDSASVRVFSVPSMRSQHAHQQHQHGSNSHASCVFRHNVLYEVRQKSLTHDRSDIHHDPVLHHYHSSHHPAFWSIE